MNQGMTSQQHILRQLVAENHPNNSSRSYNATQLMLGFLFLCFGFLYYAIFREHSPSLVQSIVGHKLYVTANLSPMLQKIFASFPSFVHVVAFALLTTGIIAAPGLKSAFGVALFWTAVNMLFELLQGMDRAAFFRVLSTIPWRMEALNQFVAGGVFDMHDMAASLFGGVIAFVVCSITNGKGEKHVA